MCCIERIYAENGHNVRREARHCSLPLTTSPVPTPRRRRCHCVFSHCLPESVWSINLHSFSKSSETPFVKTSPRIRAVSLLALLLLGAFDLASAQTSAPTLAPAVATTAAPTIPTLSPTISPLSTGIPTFSPTSSTSNPTGAPSPQPTAQPTVSSAPTTSSAPSATPSTAAPSNRPSFSELFSERGSFRLLNIIADESPIFNDTQLEQVETLFEEYTFAFNPLDAPVVTTICAVYSNQLIVSPRRTNSIDFTCDYSSRVVNVTSFPEDLAIWVDGNITGVTMDLQEIGDNVESTEIQQLEEMSPAPTTSPQPSLTPTFMPSLSSPPSSVPSSFPSESPPTTPPTISPFPTSIPTPPPQPGGIIGGGGGSSTGLIVGLVLGLGGVCLYVLFLWYRSKRRASMNAVNGDANASMRDGNSTLPNSSTSIMRRASRSNNNRGVEYGGDTITDVGAMIHPSDSLQSNRSLLSTGDDGMADDSADEADGTRNLQDEFDQYKDQTLEQFRTNIEGKLTGFEGIMSAAVTKALMGDDDDNVDVKELLWGCNEGASGAEIEASALCEVSDWMKRNELAPSERKRGFMKEILNRMVTSVRFDVIRENDASRTVHECAALLGLPLKHELPMTTVIVSGMRKTVGAKEMVSVLRYFGDIDVAAVASGQRGFGIVRFRNTKSVDRAMRQFRGGEIVVQDVAIQMKVLNPSGVVDS